MPKFLVTAKLLLNIIKEIPISEYRDTYIYENYELIAEDAKQAKEFAYWEYYSKYCKSEEQVKTAEWIWIEAEAIKLYSGKGAGKGGARRGAGREKGSGSKYSEPTKAMKVPNRFDGKVSELVQMADDLKKFINNWDEGLQPLADGHFSERKKLARKMLDDLKSVCGVLNEIPTTRED